VTWHRLEKGEPSVTLGAYLSALSVLGLDFKLVSPATDSQVSERNKHGEEGWLPARVALADYPQLKQLAWQVHGVNELTPKEALGVYERNWRHLDLAAIEPHERRLIEALRLAFEYEDRDV